MCKLLAIVDIENEDNALEFSELAIKPMTLKDDDGLGVIMLGDQGLGVERWLKPSDFPNAYVLDDKLNKYQALLPSGYNTEGDVSQTHIYAIGVHSRTATGPKCLANVHPFVREGIALIHNGVINNHEKFKKEVSSCDSEALLSLYLQENVKNDLKDIQKVTDEASGLYAFMVFDPIAKSLTITKDKSTSLFFAHVSTVGTVFCTTEEIIKSCIGRMKLKQSPIYPFPDNTSMRWIKGKESIETYGIRSKSISWSSWEDKERDKALTIVDVNKDKTDNDKWCEHGAHKGSWCGFCYSAKITEEINKDVPTR